MSATCPIRYLSVCSGVGGLDYGLDRCGWEPVAMCEAAPYPRRVLARHWPNVPVFTDIMTLRAADLSGPVDAIAGGIPCQPFSTAGKQVGTDDPRHLWPHFLRLMLETGAGLGLIENVRGLLTAQRGWAFATILREAVSAGFTVEWQILAAGTLGAPHIRQRVFLVLRRDGWTWPGVAQVGMFGTSPWADIVPPSDGWPVSGRATAAGWVRTPWVYPHPAAWPWGAVQGEMVPTPTARDWRDGACADADVETKAQLGRWAPRQTGGGKLRPQPVEWMMSWPDGWTLPDGPPLRHEEPQAWLDWPACDWTTTEKEPHRRDRLKGCGNGVVGVVGETIGQAVSATWQRARGAA